MAMAIMPAFVLTCVSILANVTLAGIGLAEGAGLWFAMRSLLECLGGIYLTLLAIGAVTTATEWDRIPGSRLAESDVHIQLPPVHVHLHPHLLCGAVHEGGVEAHPPRRGGTPAGKLNEKLNFPYCAAPHFPV